MTLDEARQLAEKIAKGPESFAAAVKGVSEKTLRYKPSPEKWCITEILAHIGDSEIVFGHRIRHALAEDKPHFSPMNQDAWAAALGYMEAGAAEHLETYSVARRANVRLLRRLKASDLERGGFHPEKNRVQTVAEIIQYMSEHDPNHLGQIERLKRQAK